METSPPQAIPAPSSLWALEGWWASSSSHLGCYSIRVLQVHAQGKARHLGSWVAEHLLQALHAQADPELRNLETQFDTRQMMQEHMNGHSESCQWSR